MYIQHIHTRVCIHTICLVRDKDVVVGFDLDIDTDINMNIDRDMVLRYRYTSRIDTACGIDIDMMGPAKADLSQPRQIFHLYLTIYLPAYLPTYLPTYLAT